MTVGLTLPFCMGGCYSLQSTYQRHY